MQNNTVMAFRKRLKNLGYTEISIKRKNYYDGFFYTVSAIEPLAGVRIICEYDRNQMNSALHKQRNTDQRVTRTDVVILRNTAHAVNRPRDNNDIDGQLSFKF
jgi:ppGpp synthetase/RelA/SpoT-type nucleotidyltranferase